MWFIKRLFNSSYKIAKKYSSVALIKTSEEDKNFIIRGYLKTKRIPCINCKKYFLVREKTRGLDIDFSCPGCGQKIVISGLDHGSIFMIEKLNTDESHINREAERSYRILKKF